MSLSLVQRANLQPSYTDPSSFAKDVSNAYVQWDKEGKKVSELKLGWNWLYTDRDSVKKGNGICLLPLTELHGKEIKSDGGRGYLKKVAEFASLLFSREETDKIEGNTLFSVKKGKELTKIDLKVNFAFKAANTFAVLPKTYRNIESFEDQVPELYEKWSDKGQRVENLSFQLVAKSDPDSSCFYKIFNPLPQIRDDDEGKRTCKMLARCVRKVAMSDDVDSVHGEMKFVLACGKDTKEVTIEFNIQGLRKIYQFVQGRREQKRMEEEKAKVQGAPLAILKLYDWDIALSKSMASSTYLKKVDARWFNAHHGLIDEYLVDYTIQKKEEPPTLKPIPTDSGWMGWFQGWPGQ